jgi:hypothetical protein
MHGSWQVVTPHMRRFQADPPSKVSFAWTTVILACLLLRVMIMRRLLIILSIVLTSWTQSLCGPLRPLGLPELTTASEAVIHGKVCSKKVARDSEGRIYTTIGIEILEVWKGDVKEPILEVVQGGGILGGQKAESPFQAHFSLGEETVVFCRFNQTGKAVTIGLTQGKFDVYSPHGMATKHARNLFHGGPPPHSPSFQSRIRMPNQVPLSLTKLKACVQGGDQ